jgi:hypothetical protein
MRVLPAAGRTKLNLTGFGRAATLGAPVPLPPRLRGKDNAAIFTIDRAVGGGHAARGLCYPFLSWLAFLPPPNQSYRFVFYL